MQNDQLHAAMVDLIDKWHQEHLKEPMRKERVYEVLSEVFFPEIFEPEYRYVENTSDCHELVFAIRGLIRDAWGADTWEDARSKYVKMDQQEQDEMDFVDLLNFIKLYRQSPAWIYT